jgi:hypothetical protein
MREVRDMICFEKPELTKDLYIVQNEELLVTCWVCARVCARYARLTKAKPHNSSERVLHKDYGRKGSNKKNLWSWASRGLPVNRQSWTNSESDSWLSEASNWGQGQSGNSDEGERPPLEAATKQRQLEHDCGH